MGVVEKVRELPIISNIDVCKYKDSTREKSDYRLET